MLRDYRRVMARLEKVRQTTTTKTDVVIMVQKLPDGRYIREYLNSDLFNVPPGKVVNFDDLFIDDKELEPMKKESVVIINDMPKEGE